VRVWGRLARGQRSAVELAGRFAAPGPARLNPHHPVTGLALHVAVQRDLGVVRASAIAAVPVSKRFHEQLPFSPKTGDGADSRASLDRRGDRSPQFSTSRTVALASAARRLQTHPA
jgi:hypothetical protein